ncbi:hypothetical protein CHS0354_022628 [Potamilus streckersoni]|uniref:Uncharacterized protein n=1 Tax=Potamilus streckersoni TaxID=2493646 RepID=A0AAE0TGY5_9BIVA|nr:hypothetical protein CHS0354_022628 [Potamilus streckersoni]
MSSLMEARDSQSELIRAGFESIKTSASSISWNDVFRLKHSAGKSDSNKIIGEVMHETREEEAFEENEKSSAIVEGIALNDLNGITQLSSTPSSPSSRKKLIKRKMRLASQSSSGSEKVSEDKVVSKSNPKKKREGEIRENEDSETNTDKDTGLDVDSDQNHENRTAADEETENGNVNEHEKTTDKMIRSRKWTQKMNMNKDKKRKW